MSLAAYTIGWLGLILLSGGGPSGPQNGQNQGQNQGKGDSPVAQGGKRNLVALPADYVRYARVPDGGVQPRLQVDSRGRIALLFFRGAGTSGDLFLARSTDEAKSFAPAVQVNSRAGSVSAFDGVHMASLTLSPDGRAYVAWVSTDTPAALCYAREKPDGGLEAEQNLGSPAGLGSCAALAVDAEGRVYIFFAALDPHPEEGAEPEQKICMLSSADGATFSEAVSIEKERFNASEHSALAAHVDAVEDTLFVLYRACFEGSQGNTRGRDMRLVASENWGESFTSGLVDNWKIKRDPRSMSQLWQDQSTTLAAYEARGQVFWTPVKRANNKVSLPFEPWTDAESWRSAAAVASNTRNEVLLSWLERPANEPTAPSVIRWQVWQKDRRASLGRGLAPEAPGSSSPAVLARADGGFTIVY